jgi:hypothetical protein
MGDRDDTISVDLVSLERVCACVDAIATPVPTLHPPPRPNCMAETGIVLPKSPIMTEIAFEATRFAGVASEFTRSNFGHKSVFVVERFELKVP